jgi:hypothetical protein
MCQTSEVFETSEVLCADEWELCESHVLGCFVRRKLPKTLIPPSIHAVFFNYGFVPIAGFH